MDIALFVSGCVLNSSILAGAPCEFLLSCCGATEKRTAGAVLFGNLASISILLNGENSQANLTEILFVWNEGFAGKVGAEGLTRVRSSADTPIS